MLLAEAADAELERGLSSQLPPFFFVQDSDSVLADKMVEPSHFAEFFAFSRCLVVILLRPSDWENAGRTSKHPADDLVALTSPFFSSCLPPPSRPPTPVLWCVVSTRARQNPASWRDLDDDSPSTLPVGTPGPSSVRHLSHGGDGASRLGEDTVSWLLLASSTLMLSLQEVLFGALLLNERVTVWQQRW